MDSNDRVGDLSPGALLRWALEQSHWSVAKLVAQGKQAEEEWSSAANRIGGEQPPPFPSEDTVYRYLKEEIPDTSKGESQQVVALDRFFEQHLRGVYPPAGLSAAVRRASVAKSTSSGGTAEGGASGNVADLALGDPAHPFRGRRANAVGIGIAAFVLLVIVTVVVVSRDHPRQRSGSLSVDATGPGEDPTVGVSVWDRPATNICNGDLPGCDLNAKRVAKVEPGEKLAPQCISHGQLVRNGYVGGPGYYEDDRWLKVTVDEVTGFLPNTWFARTGLPDFPACAVGPSD